jgi:hypothetical protein
MRQNLNKKNKDKIYKGLLRDYENGNKLFYNAIEEKPINALRLASAMFYLNKVTYEIISFGLREIIEQCESENESKDTL